MAITVDVSNTFKHIFSQGTLESKELMNKLYTPGQSAIHFGSNGRLERTTNRYAVLAKASLEAKLQKFQVPFTPDGAMAFLGVEHPLHHVKVDGKFSPDELTEQFNIYLEGVDENDRSKWTFARWYINEHLVPSIIEDQELRVDYKGEIGAITPGTAQFNANQGFGVQVNLWIDDDDVEPIPLNPSATPATFVNQLTTFVKAVRDSSPEMKQMYYRGMFDEIIMSPELHERFIQGMDEAYNGVYARVSQGILTNDASQLQMVIPGTQGIRTRGLQSMTGSNKIIFTPKWNRFGKIRSEGRFLSPLAGIADGGREVWVTMDWWTRVGFYLPTYLFTNDQDIAFGV